MKGPTEPTPAEPTPTEQIVLVENESPRAGVRLRENTFGAGRDDYEMYSRTKLEKAYPWLLGASTCLSAILCWMYVTKPVLAVDEAGGVTERRPTVALSTAPSDAAAAGIKPTAGDLVPSDTDLPGAQSSTSGAAGESVETGSPETIDLQRLAAGGDSSAMASGWESTNLKVQHILSADVGDGELEKIVINVPVIYETRTMRWTSADMVKARDVLSRLMVYERNLSNLRKEGQALFDDWNQLLEATVPAAALRADSVSLPYNHSFGSRRGSLPSSSSSIKVAH
ncbi:MAG: hypothetical protein KJO21_08045 [Verrucomicrobiae bacterium]|nr:hypothetical protein [Verrucomicrobiae bacterium]NNJ43425.1 hypothetical protein [Akkermansiaceae bacterium]